MSDRLFAEGARDVWLTPVQMKKGRPGVVLSAIVAAADEDKVADLLLRETTTTPPSSTLAVMPPWPRIA